LAEAGYVPGQNVKIEYRWAAGQYDLLPELASELVRSRVSAIVTSGGTAAILAAKAATATIPIVFNSGADPVSTGAVESLNRPSLNLTGFSNLTNEVQPKALGLLHELLPAAKVIGFVVNRANPTSAPQERELEDAATKLGIRLEVLDASAEREIETTIVEAARRGVAAVFVMSDGFLVSQSDKIAVLALQQKIPTVATTVDLAEAGGFLTYGPDLRASYQQSGVYVARILKGAKVADLPVVQSTKLELTINLKTAKALGLTVPPSLLARADEVIE
jgi:putative ABC transport system substrate-binding protein